MGMAVVETPYEIDMRKAVEEITKKMESLDTTTDGIQMFVNHWGRWCAKYKTRKGVVYYAFDHSPLGALEKLRDNPTQEECPYSRE